MKHKLNLFTALVLMAAIYSLLLGFSTASALDFEGMLKKATELNKPSVDTQKSTAEEQKPATSQDSPSEAKSESAAPAQAEDWSNKWLLQAGYKSGGERHKIDANGRFVPPSIGSSYDEFRNGDKVLFRAETMDGSMLDVSEVTVKIVEGIGYRNTMSMYDDGKALSTSQVSMNPKATFFSFQIPFSFTGKRGQYNIYLYDKTGNLRAKCGLELTR